jgi:hypothetical protein
MNLPRGNFIKWKFLCKEYRDRHFNLGIRLIISAQEVPFSNSQIAVNSLSLLFSIGIDNAVSAPRKKIMNDKVPHEVILDLTHTQPHGKSH